MAVKLGRLSFGFLTLPLCERSCLGLGGRVRRSRAEGVGSDDSLIHLTGLRYPLVGGCAHFLEMTGLHETKSDDASDASNVF